MTILDSDDALKAGVEALGRLDPVMARLVREGAVPRLRRRPAGFEGLIWIVVGQQVSTASAAAIWARFEARLAPLDHTTVLRARRDKLVRIGLSGAKPVSGRRNSLPGW